ncbi:hypothetical protein [Polaribacter cellanae]|uniref:hypothetical protein n=1 Tax=Polaribacter cellanae TaxID=2818493 RepID=UPI001FB7025B|nr:hypothetical protein [Polaribacter cellanae]
MILYIHNNPIQHNFVEKLADYYWSSYSAIISDQKTLIEREKVIDYFDDKQNFIDTHQQKIDAFSIDEWLKI